MNKGILFLLVFSFIGCGRGSRMAPPTGEVKLKGGGNGADQMPEVLPQNTQLTLKKDYPFIPPAKKPTLPAFPTATPIQNSGIVIPEPKKPQINPTPAKIYPATPTPVIITATPTPSPVVKPTSTPVVKPIATPAPRPSATPAIVVPTPQKPTPRPVVTPTPSTQKPTDDIVMPNWDSSWSNVVMNSVESMAPNLLKGSNDMDQFCPIYSKLEHDKRLKFWAHFFYALAFAESGLNPYSRFLESGFDYNDPTTKQSVRSEGLLQLSYGDARQYEFCRFDWKIDKKLKPWDHKKTIFDPERNLQCGVGILNKLVGEGDGTLTGQGGRYWSVLRPQRLAFKKILRVIRYNKVCSESWLK